MLWGDAGTTLRNLHSRAGVKSICRSSKEPLFYRYATSKAAKYYQLFRGQSKHKGGIWKVSHI